MTRRLPWFLLLALVTSGVAWGQSATSTISDRTIRVGETVTFTVTMRGGAARRVGPPLASGALRLASQAPILDNTITFNGETERTVAWAYVGTREGTGRIGRFRAQVGGRSVAASGFSVTVQQAPAGSASGAGSRVPAMGDRELVVRAEPSRRTAVVGQQVVVDYVLYFEPQVQPRQTAPVGTWDAPGAWREEMELSTAYPRPARLDGRALEAVTIRRIALFPTRSGTLELAPMEFSVDLLRTDRSFSNNPLAPFFSPFRQRVEDREVTAPGVSIEVNDLPPGAPPSFRGAVGDFSLSSRVGDGAVEAGQAVDLSVTIRGDGNLATLEAPALEVPPGVDVYDPAADQELFRSGSRLNGVKTFDYTLVPQGGGTFDVPAAPWTYFDPADGTYKTLRVDPVEIEASGDPLAAAVPDDPDGPAGLMTEAEWVRSSGRPVWLWGVLGGGLALPALAFLALVGVRRGRERLTADTPEKRSRRAGSAASARLGEARRQAGPAAAAEAERAVRAFLGDRFGLRPVPLAADGLDAALAERGVPADLRDRTRAVLAEATRAQFAPGLGDLDLAAAEAVLADLDAVPRQPQSRRPMPA